MEGFNLGPEWIWKAIFIFATIGVLAAIVGGAYLTWYLFNHVSVDPLTIKTKSIMKDDLFNETHPKSLNTLKIALWAVVLAASGFWSWMLWQLFWYFYG